jgi:PBP1b-binding outer membrane lipoprotein LpoB
MKKLVCLVGILMFASSCSNRKKELETERDENLKLRMHYLDVITEKQKMLNKGVYLSSKETKSEIKKIDIIVLKLETRYKVINDSIEILR